MPAERSRSSKCDDVDGAQLTWPVSVQSASPQSIAFTPNVTPVTFNDPPPFVEATFEPILFPSPGSEVSARRPAHSKKRGEDHIPRPPNAFILFRSSFIKSQHISTEVETNHSTLSKIIGLTWQNMPHDERQIWHAKAKKALEEHKKKWPQYSFRPSHSKTKAKGGTEKRKVREVGPKDLKRCAKIAELLVEGKKGAELDAAIQEFDRTHIPEIVTRFETPITAGSYRRSSSAPIDDAQSQKLAAACHRARSVCSQPPSRLAEESHLSAPLGPSQSCPDLSSSHSFVPPPQYSFASKLQPSFDLDPFMFNVAFGDSILPSSTDLGSYPSAATGRVHTPTLCVDPAYGSDWTPASSPFSSLPPTPQALSPSPGFDCGLDSEDPFALNPYTLTSNQLQPCGQQYPADLNVFDHENALDSPLFPQHSFPAFSKDPFPFDYSEKSVPGVGTDLSAFLSSLSGY